MQGIRRYCNMDFSLDDMDKLIYTADYKEVESLLLQSLEGTKKRIAWYQELSWVTQRIVEDWRQIENGLGKCEITMSDNMTSPVGSLWLRGHNFETKQGVFDASMAFVTGTCGGLDINEHFEVLTAGDGTVIDDLYAVGTDAMGTLFTEKKPFVTYGGANNGWGLVSGYLCGREIAQKLGK